MADFSRQAMERIRRTVRDHERERPLPRQQRRKYPIGGGGTKILLAKCSNSVSKGNSDTFTVYGTTSSATKGAETTTTRQLTAYVRVGDYTANKWAYLVKFGNGWEVLQTECAS